jgi:glucose dehydrogenase
MAVYGRTYDEQRFSPLTASMPATSRSSDSPGSYDLDTAHRVQSRRRWSSTASMYVTSAWSKLFALDARTGKEIWRFDPKVPGEVAVKACCDVGNRGVAAWRGRIYLATLDGRLLAIDAATGKQLWEVMTVPPGQNYTITGAPRVFDGKVLIGNGGAELGARGYVTAYDAADGKQIWRFYTVPGDPAKGFEKPGAREGRQDLEGAVVEVRRRRHGVGFHRLRPRNSDSYISVSAMAAPGTRRCAARAAATTCISLRSSQSRPTPASTCGISRPRRARPGTSPRPSPSSLRTWRSAGKPRQVLMQAPKNGFFYVIDRTNGEFISARRMPS